jgi:hypothetical protein
MRLETSRLVIASNLGLVKVSVSCEVPLLAPLLSDEYHNAPRHMATLWMFERVILTAMVHSVFLGVYGVHASRRLVSV